MTLHRRYYLTPIAIFSILGLTQPVSASLLEAPTANLPGLTCSDDLIYANRVPEVIPPFQCRMTGKIVKFKGIGVQVPPRGEGLAGNALGHSKPGVSLTVRHATDGTVHIETSYSSADETAQTTPSPDAAPQAPRACTDTAHKLWGFQIRDLPWEYKYGGEPANMRISVVVDELRRAINNIDGRQTGCSGFGNTPISKARPSYQGLSPFGAQINDAAQCLDGNDFSTVEWGRLPAGFLAYNCTENPGPGGVTDGSDTRYNNTVRWTANVANCTGGQFGFQDAATHEWGHTYGLGHVREDLYPTLTMSDASGPCQNLNNTLGRGDVRGLNRNYA